ncbi:hypothetical protein VRRI112168_03675 [Vreelandella rituensis]|uniref:Uncharacterized protein n=1 Tax=Vreelandella rituensis TaxID=2282306 RepID=A0A368U9Y5_9GAMM|nr:hypothetical protein [Halomonas rituensis]RCV93751.1 hypothetical protein DU506_00940 [Halomonas rituensis]
MSAELPVIIRSHGQDHASSLGKVADTLARDFRGKHVALHWRRVSSGMRQLALVSITDGGDITFTYNGQHFPIESEIYP